MERVRHLERLSSPDAVKEFLRVRLPHSTLAAHVATADVGEGPPPTRSAGAISGILGEVASGAEALADTTSDTRT
jgi:hypothetical protein